MRTREHIVKTRRLEATMGRMDEADDFEMIIEICMLAGTHLLNAALHAEGVSHGHQDQSHTDRPPLTFLNKEPSDMLQQGMKALAYVEGLRKTYVRGGEPYDADVARKCLDSYRECRACFMDIVGSRADRPEWAEAGDPDWSVPA